MSRERLIDFRRRMGLSQQDIAARLGVSRRAWGLYESGQKPIPRVVSMACAALAFGLPGMVFQSNDPEMDAALDESSARFREAIKGAPRERPEKPTLPPDWGMEE